MKLYADFPLRGWWALLSPLLFKGQLYVSEMEICICVRVCVGFQWLNGKEPACQCRRLKRPSPIPGSGRSPGAGHDNPFQYFCLENPMDRAAWQATVQSHKELDMTEATKR